MALGGLQERVRPAEAEADRDRALDAGLLLQERERGRDVECDGLGRGLLDVRHVLEVLVARAEPGGAAEVVDRDRGVAGGGEALGELLVEAEQAAHVGQDDDAGRALGAGEVGARIGAVGGLVSVWRSPAAPPAMTWKPGGRSGTIASNGKHMA